MFFLPNLILPKRHHFGLSIGRASLRAVETNSAGKVISTAEVILPEDAFKSGVLIKKDAFGNALKQLLQKGKFTTPYVVVCFSETYAFSREYQLPVIPKEEITEAISWHLSELMPYPKDEIYYDWKLIEKTEQEYKLAVVAVQKKVIDPVVEMMLSVNLKPLSFEPGTSAISRLLNLKDKEQVLIVEINKMGAYVTLVVSKKALFTTVVNYTSEDTPKSYMANIIQTIKEMTRYYKEKNLIKEENVGILLTGELTTEEWLASVDKTGCPYPMKILHLGIVPPAFNKAYAAAITDIDNTVIENKVNLLPDALRKYYDHQRDMLFFKSLLMRVSAVVSFFCLISLLIFIWVRIERQQLDIQVDRLNQNTQQQGSEIQDLLLLNAHAGNIVTLAPLRQTPKDKLLVIASVIPEGIIITSWEYDDNKLMFATNGISANREQLLLFKDKLEQTGEFDKVSLPLGSLESSENIKFNLTFITKK